MIHEGTTTRWHQLTYHLCNCFLIFCNYFPVRLGMKSELLVCFCILFIFLLWNVSCDSGENSEASYLISKTSALLSSYFLFHSLTSISLVMIWMAEGRRMFRSKKWLFSQLGRVREKWGCASYIPLLWSWWELQPCPSHSEVHCPGTGLPCLGTHCCSSLSFGSWKSHSVEHADNTLLSVRLQHPRSLQEDSLSDVTKTYYICCFYFSFQTTQSPCSKFFGETVSIAAHFISQTFVWPKGLRKVILDNHCVSKNY